MIYMLDSDVCAYVINQQPISYCKKLESIEQKYTIAISSIVLAELQYGVVNSKHQQQNQIKLDAFITKVEVMDFSAKCALYYGRLRVYLKQKGIIIGNNDLLIASHALCEQAVLVTNNLGEFERVPKLIVENWDDK